MNAKPFQPIILVEKTRNLAILGFQLNNALLTIEQTLLYFEMQAKNHGEHRDYWSYNREGNTLTVYMSRRDPILIPLQPPGFLISYQVPMEIINWMPAQVYFAFAPETPVTVIEENNQTQTTLQEFLRTTS